ncbi:N-acetyltransferase family protein [Kitasatospora sp. NPDC054795]
MSGVVNVAAMTPAHAAQVLEIYRSGIDGGDATFETGVPGWEAFDAARMAEHRLVALDGSGGSDGFARVLGWAALARRGPSGAPQPGGRLTGPLTERPTGPQFGQLAGPPSNRL